MPILVSTITTIVVFFPVLFLAGVARNLFLPLALTIAFALVMSFFVSRTVTPLLCLYVLKGARPGERRARGIAGAITPRARPHRSRLRAQPGLGAAPPPGHRRRASWRCSALSLFLKRCIGTEFFPDSDESQFAVNFKAPIGTRVERTEQVADADRRRRRGAR